MWTKKSTAMAGGGLFLAVAGIFFLNYLFISTGIVMLTFILLASFFNLWMPRVEVSRESTGDSTFEDGEITITFTLANKGLGRGFVEVYDQLPPQVQLVAGSNYALLYMRARQKVTFSYSLRCPMRGFYHLGPVKLRVKDAFDLFYTEDTIRSRHDISIFPKLEEVRGTIIHSRYPRLYQGAMVVHATGSGTQFYSLRDFLPGDSLRQVNWKAFARTGELMVNETEREDIQDILIVVDSRVVSGVGTAQLNPLELSCRAAATLASHFLQNRNNVACAVYGEKIEKINLDHGEQQMFRILTSLAGAKAQGDLPLAAVMSDLLPYFTPSSPIIIFSSLDNDDSVTSAMQNMVGAGFEVIVVSPSSVDIEVQMGRIPPDPFQVARMERDNLLSEIRGYGVRVADWLPNQSLTNILAEVVEQ